jgi:hypothetical protein
MPNITNERNAFYMHLGTSWYSSLVWWACLDEFKIETCSKLVRRESCKHADRCKKAISGFE